MPISNRFQVELFDNGHFEWFEVMPHCTFDLHVSNNSLCRMSFNVLFKKNLVGSTRREGFCLRLWLWSPSSPPSPLRPWPTGWSAHVRTSRGSPRPHPSPHPPTLLRDSISVYTHPGGRAQGGARMHFVS